MTSTKKASGKKKSSGRKKAPAKRAREAVAAPKPEPKAPLKVEAGGAKGAASTNGGGLTKGSLITLKAQLKAGIEAEDEMLLAFAAKVRENLRLEQLIETEEDRPRSK